MTTVTRERLTKILIETMALIKQRSSCTGHSSGISSEVNTELFAEITRLALASLDAVASYPEKLPCPVFLEPGLRFGKGVTTSLMLVALQRRAEYYAELDAMTPEQRAEHDAGIAEFKALLGHPIIADNVDLITDSKRLDWLDAQNKRLNEYYGTSYGWKFDANFQRNAMMLNDSNYPFMTVRQAIDEAIAAATKKEGA